MAKTSGAAEVIRNYRNWTSGARQAGYTVAVGLAAGLAQELQDRAPWQDVTGEARAELRAEAAILGAEQTNPLPETVALAAGGLARQDAVVIVLSGNSDHSIFLELGPYGLDVVWPVALAESGPVCGAITHAVLEAQQSSAASNLAGVAQAAAGLLL